MIPFLERLNTGIILMLKVRIMVILGGVMIGRGYKWCGCKGMFYFMDIY